MIYLLTYPAKMGLYSPSPFCVKAAYLLQMSGLEWKREDLEDPRKMPMGKLPAIRVDGKIIADSGAIRDYLQTRGVDFDKDLGPKQRAAAHALTRMVEDNLYFLLMQDRWANDAVWPTVREAYFAHLPPGLRQILPIVLRRDVLSTLKGQGTGRFSDADRLARADRDLVAIADFLGEKPFLMGTDLTGVDCSVAAMPGGMRISPVPTDLSRRVVSDARLVAYLDRVETQMALN